MTHALILSLPGDNAIEKRGWSLSTLTSEALFCCFGGCNSDEGHADDVVLLYLPQKYPLCAHSRDIWPMKNSWAAGLTQMRGEETRKHEAVSPITPTDGAVTGPNWRMHISSNRILCPFSLCFKEKKAGWARKMVEVVETMTSQGAMRCAAEWASKSHWCYRGSACSLARRASSLSAQRRWSGEIGRPLSFTLSLDESRSERVIRTNRNREGKKKCLKNWPWLQQEATNVEHVQCITNIDRETIPVCDRRIWMSSICCHE